jgi:hypothetical protein
MYAGTRVHGINDEIIFVVAVVDSVQMVMYTNAKSMGRKDAEL